MSANSGPRGIFALWQKTKEFFAGSKPALSNDPSPPTPVSSRNSIKTSSNERDRLEKATHDALVRRRGALKESGVKVDDLPAMGHLGIAFSGGGIRSATFSLGVAQSLARRSRLLDFDYISTVSGGGYFGSFLTSLFLPGKSRGLAGTVTVSATSSDLKRKREFGEQTLKADARAVFFPGRGATKPIRNPVWWLREHSRYLAPNGPTDYTMAVTVVVRNWLAMLYVFILPIAAFFLLLISLQCVGSGSFLQWLAVKMSNSGGNALLGNAIALSKISFTWVGEDVSYISPLLVVALTLLLVGVASGLTYWLTEWLPTGLKRNKRLGWWRRPRLAFLTGTITSLAIAGSGLYLFVQFGALLTPAAQGFFKLVLLLSFGAIGVAIAISPTVVGLRGDHFVMEMRRRSTAFGATFNQGALIVFLLGLIDTAANWLLIRAQPTDSPSNLGYYFAFLAPFAPAVAWLINKLPQWVNGKETRIRQILAKHIWSVALFIGAGMFAILAVFVDLTVRILLLPAKPSGATDFLKDFHPTTFFVLAATVTAALLATGASTGFINLSSLHGFYAARLTRAFLGATNTYRLRRAANEDKVFQITENHDHDDIDIAVYQQARSVAPLHLINVTLNETRNREGSQLVERDRKGVPIVFAPEGMLLDAAREERASKRFYFSWSDLSLAEGLSVGQLCAISGAAASSGMGASTTLGGALALTFANVRLGYWWNVGSMVRDANTFRPTLWQRIFVRSTKWLRTYFYLSNEMTGRYSRDYDRLYLSDGGHFDNSGAYELLRRDVKLILVCDSGADPDFNFDDLENVIRKARVDLGLAINVAKPAHIEEIYGKGGSKIFFNGVAGDWRKQARDENCTAVAVLLNVFGPRPEPNLPPELRNRIIWIKPRAFSNLPQDVVGYALSHPTFPHETTGDQFFNEEQWESYRALGFFTMEWFLINSFFKEDVLRNMAASIPLD